MAVCECCSGGGMLIRVRPCGWGVDVLLGFASQFICIISAVPRCPGASFVALVSGVPLGPGIPINTLLPFFFRAYHVALLTSFYVIPVYPLAVLLIVAVLLLLCVIWYIFSGWMDGYSH